VQRVSLLVQNVEDQPVCAAPEPLLKWHLNLDHVTGPESLGQPTHRAPTVDEDPLLREDMELGLRTADPLMKMHARSEGDRLIMREAKGGARRPEHHTIRHLHR